MLDRYALLATVAPDYAHGDCCHSAGVDSWLPSQCSLCRVQGPAWALISAPMPGGAADVGCPCCAGWLLLSGSRNIHLHTSASHVFGCRHAVRMNPTRGGQEMGLLPMFCQSMASHGFECPCRAGWLPPSGPCSGWSPHRHCGVPERRGHNRSVHQDCTVQQVSLAFREL